MANKKKLSEKIKTTHLSVLRKYGAQGFYERAVGGGMLQSAKTEHPEIHMLDMAEAFFALFRSTGEEDYATISRLFRKAAHTVYRELKRQNGNKNTEKHRRFLTLCS